MVIFIIFAVISIGYGMMIRSVASGSRFYLFWIMLGVFFLILAGGLTVWIGEYRNPATIGNLRFGEKVLASLFQSVTFRTAGFSTIPQQELTPFTCIAGLFYMFIGQTFHQLMIFIARLVYGYSRNNIPL